MTWFFKMVMLFISNFYQLLQPANQMNLYRRQKLKVSRLTGNRKLLMRLSTTLIQENPLALLNRIGMHLKDTQIIA